MRTIKMKSGSVPGKAKAIALTLLITSIGLGSAAFAASSAHSKTGIQGTVVAATTQTQSSSAGFELDYFHAERVSKTYAIRLKNGLSASFDFQNGTATLTDVTGHQTTLPLEQVLLQATNGNSQAAAQMYDNCISPSAPPSPTRSWRMQDQRALAPTFVSRLAEQGTSVRIFSFRHHAIRAGLATTTVHCGPLQPVATASPSLVHATNGREACQTGVLAGCQIGARTTSGGAVPSEILRRLLNRRAPTGVLPTTLIASFGNTTEKTHVTSWYRTTCLKAEWM